MITARTVAVEVLLAGSVVEVVSARARRRGF
jgi:hypothetical protein